MADRDDILRDDLLREEVDDSFAPAYVTAPAPAPLPALPKPNVPTGTSGIGRVLAGAARLGNVLLGLIIPMNSGQEGTGNLFGGPGALYPDGPPPPPPPEVLPALDPVYVVPPEPLMELEPVYITPPPRPPTTTHIGEDPIMPPNWNDLSNPGGLDFGRPTGPGIPLIPYPVIDDSVGSDPLRPGDEYLIPDRVVGPDTGLPVEFAPELEPFRAPTPSPGVRAPFLLPFAFPGPELRPTLDPIDQPVPQPGTRTKPGPLATPLPGTGTDLLNLPIFPAFPIAPPDNYRPPVSNPLFSGDPADELNRDFDQQPEFRPQDPEDKKDTCGCDKKPKKKKPKRKERAICYEGKYRQLKKSINYYPGKVVPCTGPTPKSATESRPKRPRSPSLGKLTKEVLGL